MKKTFFTLTLLTSIILSAKDFGGYINLDSKYFHRLKEFRYDENNKIVTEDLKEPQRQEFANLFHLGIYGGNESQGMGFLGFDTKNINELKIEAKGTVLSKSNTIQNIYKIYGGARFDDKINKDTNYVSFLAYNRNFKDKNMFEDVIIKHLKQRNEFNETRYKEDKKNYILENGLNLDTYDNNQMVASFVLDTKVNRRTLLHVGNVFDFNEVQKGNKTSFNANNIAFLRSITRANRSMIKTDFKYLLNKNNYKNYGDFSGDINVNTKIKTDLILNNEIFLNVGKKKGSLDFGLKNKIKYLMNSNIDFEGELNYIRNSSLENTNKIINHENKAKFAFNYKKESLYSSVDLVNKFIVKQTLNDKNQNTKTEIDNKINFNANVGYLKNGFGVEFSSKGYFDLENRDVLLGPKLSYKNNVGIANIDAFVDFKYLNRKHTEESHHFFLKAVSDLKLKFNDSNSLDYLISLYNYNNLFTNDFVLEPTRDRITILEQDLKYTNDNSYLKTTLQLGASFLNFEKKEAKAVENPDRKNFEDISAKVKLNSEFRFKAPNKLDVVLALNNTYVYNALQENHYQMYKEYISNTAFKDGEFYFEKDALDKNIFAADAYAKKIGGSRYSNYKNEENNIYKPISKKRVYIEQKEKNTIHSLRVNPKISLVKRIDKLQIIPFVEGIFDFREFKFTTPEYNVAKNINTQISKDKTKNKEEKKVAKDNFDKALNILKSSQKFSLKIAEARVGLNLKYEW